ncbi:MAG: OmpA family protein [Bdellovibrionales bacterium]
MMLPVRLSTCLMLSVSVAALTVAPVSRSYAQISSQTTSNVYVNQSILTEPPAGIIPEGMEWNHPLKAGDMALPRLSKTKKTTTTKKSTATTASQLAVGELKAPQIESSGKEEPHLTNPSSSAASLMLLQGMKSALQKAGQNPDIPKSNMEAIDPLAPKPPVLAKAESTETSAPKPAEPVKEEGLFAKAVAPEEKEGAPSYVEGREPQQWAAPGSEAAPKAENADTASDIVFPPEMANDSDGSAPKATDLQNAPSSLEDMVVPQAQTENPATADADTAMAAKTEATDTEKDEEAEEKEDKRSFFERLASPITSIFGEPVQEDEAATTEESPSKETTTEEAVAPAKDECVPHVEKWTHSCQSAGYPAHFVGEIVGETRVDCKSNEAKDVWLSNSCAAPIASSAVAIQAPSGASVSSETIAESSTQAAASAQSVMLGEAATATDGACGVANGLPANRKPLTDLCDKGLATDVSGDGPWRWSCKGTHGGMTVSCAAPVAPHAKESPSTDKANEPAALPPRIEDGKCGTASRGGRTSIPTEDLCEKGTPSNVNGNGPWTWACSGLNGGAAAACTANKLTDGTCGKAHNLGTDSLPSHDLCDSGYASAVTGDGPWSWTCSGLYGGKADTCQAPLKTNAVCGPASMKGHKTTPSNGLCSVGTATDVSGEGPWSWSCEGSNGGASVPCQATVMGDGQCGPAHGNQYTESPAEGLCAQGTATRVTGFGPWTWSCQGDNDGATASCTAAIGTKEAVANVVRCGAASETLVLEKPSENLCASGSASAVEGTGPWNWSCADQAGHKTECSTLTATEGVCGTAAGKPTKTEPTTGLCEKGLSGDVLMYQKTSWKWQCQGALGADSVTCTAPIDGSASATPSPVPEVVTPATEVQPSCGSAIQQGWESKPDENLCTAGKAGSVRGHGPWTWSCGSQTGKVVCEAQKLVQGHCGSANGSVQKSAPTSGLCATGKSTKVTGEGPWMWSCIGSGGGVSSSCSASSFSQTRVDGLCGVAANTPVTSTPKLNLCDSGTPSTVYGDGPWTWTCSGMNGGIASTCTASKVVPQAPPPPGPMVNGLCGTANGVAAKRAPTDGLCTSGTVSAMSGNGPWNWSCIGENGGMTVSCTAPLVPPPPIVGECGSASGVPSLTTPRNGLCDAGISSAVSGKGPWTWSCSGTNGGGAVSCVAPLAGKGASTEGLPSIVTPSLEENVAPTPRAAPVGLVIPQLPSGPLPALKSGELPKLKASNTKISKTVKKASEKVIPTAPDEVPQLPASMTSVTPPPIRDLSKPLPGLLPPVLDREGNPVPGAKLVLDPDISTISFERGSDQLDVDAVEIIQKVIDVLSANTNARITLTAYADTNGRLSPREARRLSLNRALAVRDFMTTKGVASSRVDVRPMGANVASGDMDRLDMKIN